ncbi:MAG: nucleotidyl transferase AbiEii/AbiGii toxin family protein [Deltaproteobacteria bacterium]|nr:nucleotidyl transferase AbiEii/AbiGii toxin family protein [Deltaproteobacteria bacterium]
MSSSFADFIVLNREERSDIFNAASERLNTRPAYIEKDFWVCVVLDVLFNRLPSDSARLLFKGGTSLSKGFGLINRFSEDIDIVVFREDLGFGGDEDPTSRDVSIGTKDRRRRFDALKAACGNYVRGQLASELTRLLETKGCRVANDDSDPDQQTLLVEYPSVSVTGSSSGYVQPRVKIECGARSALDPSTTINPTAFIQVELGDDWDLKARNVSCIRPERTYWEKLLILHGVHCGFRDGQRLPGDSNRLSRHYYDVAMISVTEIGVAAHKNTTLWDDVREHHLVAFRQGWKKFEEAKRGSLRLVPQDAVRVELRRDYEAMQGMIMGDAPAFETMIERLGTIEADLNAAEAEESYAESS